MGGFFSNIISKFGSASRSELLTVALFGKHPGASDHFEYLPPGDAILNEIWTLLYRRSMEGLIVSWNEAEVKDRLADFNHVWLWSRGNDWVAGRMWSSADSTGRPHFPLVVCVHGTGRCTPFFLQSIMPALERTEKYCKQTKSIEDIQGYADKIQSQLREQAVIDDVSKSPPVSWLRALLELPEYQQHPDRLHRLLFPFSDDLLEKDEAASKILGSIPPSYSLRMPRCVESAEKSLLVWQELLSRLTGASTQLMTIAPLDHPWVDVLAGNISTAGLLCIKASLHRRRYSNEGDQNVTPLFVQEVNRFIASIQNSENRVPSRK